MKMSASTSGISIKIKRKWYYSYLGYFKKGEK